jgi:hypothetical protein
VGNRVLCPDSTTRAILSATFSTKPLPSISRPDTRWQVAGQFDGQGDHHTPRPYVRQAFRKYLECGIFAHGFARAWSDDCGHDHFVAYS